MTDEAESAGPDDSDGGRDELGADAAASPEQLLGAAKAARRQARRARHAYWFPLVLFGLLTCAAVPFYIERFPARSGAYTTSSPWFLRTYLGGSDPFMSGNVAYYWLGAILAGLAATAVWYRLRGDRIGLRTPSRGFVITGLVLLVLALVIPVLADHASDLFPDLLVRGTFPLVLIGLGLCVLAWDIGPAASGLPNVVLPALVLLLSGASAWVVQRQRRSGLAGPSESGDMAGEPP